MVKKGHIWSDEVIQRRANSNRGKKRSEESCKRMHDAQIRIMQQNPEIIIKKRDMANKQWLNPSMREAARMRAIKQFSDPAQRERARIQQLGKKLSDETKAKISFAHKTIQNTKESKQKQRDSHKGSKSHLWKNGITPLALSIRHSFRMRDWKYAVFGRDNFTCQSCKRGNVFLNAHHIKPFKDLLIENEIYTMADAEKCEELWDINNGITLCEKCHAKEHPDINSFKRKH